MGGYTALVAVCDGVGGLAAGEVASASVVHWLTEWFEQTYSSWLRGHPDAESQEVFAWVHDSWATGINQLNDAISRYGKELGNKLGTTVTATLFYGSDYYICHVGDCRVYRFRDGEIEQITEDQTWVAREVARGTITPEQARNHPQRSVILQSVGTQSEVYPVYLDGSWLENDVYMTCCDGFRNELFDDELQKTFAPMHGSSEKMMALEAKRLGELAMRRGERDNVTAVVLACVPGEVPDDEQLVVDGDVTYVAVEFEGDEPTGMLLDQTEEEPPETDGHSSVSVIPEAPATEAGE